MPCGICWPSPSQEHIRWSSCAARLLSSSAGACASLPRWRWLKRHHPRMRRQTRRPISQLPVLYRLPAYPFSAARARRSEYDSGQLRGDARILHALNRLTFGPRPGDLEAVRALGPGNTGLEKWFDQQLHPGNIDETDMDARLAQFRPCSGARKTCSIACRARQ